VLCITTSLSSTHPVSYTIQKPSNNQSRVAALPNDPARGHPEEVSRLEETDGLAHRRLDVKRLDVLPVLLEQGDQEVDAQHDVGKDLVLSHGDVADSDTQAKNLLQLELDGGLDLNKFVAEILSVGDWGGELSSLGKTGSEETGDLLDESLGGQEGIVLLGELLDELLVLVELLQVISGHVLHLDLLRAINIRGIGKNADGETGTGDVRELDGSRETLITLGVVVLEADLELDGLHKVTALLASVRLIKEVFDRASHAGH